MMDPAISLQRAIAEPVEVVPSDPSWAISFELERQRLVGLCPRVFIDLQHIGSTAVAGLPATPVIDILAGVASMARALALAPALRKAGYTSSEVVNAALPDSQWFMRWANGQRTHHLYVAVHDDDYWLDRLRFRDLLRRDTDLAGRYLALKQALVLRHGRDREAYTDGKSDFVRQALEPPEADEFEMK